MTVRILAGVAALSMLSASVAYAADESDPPPPRFRPWQLVWQCNDIRVSVTGRDPEPDGPDGVLHAKGVVADNEAVFVISANLTEAAFDRNIELGLLVRDRALALSVSSHFRKLIGRGLLRPLPAS
jgi:phosphatidylserine/phosphatidylglycerophosphate/cardiolipin synthase-like enzyme